MRSSPTADALHPRAASLPGESRATSRRRAPLLELCLTSVDHFRQRPKAGDHLGIEPPVHADRRDRLAARLEPRLVVFANVDARIPEQRADATDDARDVAIAKDDERSLRHDVDVVLADAHNTRMPAAEQRTSHAHLALATRRAQLDELGERRMRAQSRSTHIESAHFREMAG